MRRVILLVLLACGLVSCWALPASAAPAWSPAQSLSVAGNEVDDQPSAAIADGGFGSEAWAETVAGASVVRVALHAPGGNWVTSTQDISGGLPGEQCTPFTSIDGSGNALVVWAQFAGPGCSGMQTILAATHAAGAGAWSSPIVVGSTAAPGDWGLAGAANAAGQMVVAWETADATNNHIFASVGSVNGVFSAQAQVEQKPLATYLPYLIAGIGTSGDAAVQWNDNEVANSGTSNVVASVRARGSSFPATPTAITTYTSPSTAYEGTIAVDAAGDVISAYPNAIGGETYASRYRTAGATGVWGAEQTIDVPVSPFTPSWVAVGMDAAGDATAMMVDTDFTSPSPHQRQLWSSVRPTGTTSTWSAAVSVGGPEASDDFETFLAVAASGAAVATWGTTAPSQSVQVVSRPAGGQFGALTSISTGDLGAPAIAPSGDAVVGLLGSSHDARASVFDTTMPAITAATVPASATTGGTVSMSATAVDGWSGLAAGQPRWSFGDGASGSGATVTHVFATPGTYTVTIDATDGVGLAAAPVTRQIAVSAPVLPPPAPKLTTVKKPVAKLSYRASKLVGSFTVSGTLSVPTRLTVAIRRHGAKKVAVQSSFASPAGAWKRALKLPSTLAPGVYDVLVSGSGVQGSQTSFTIAAPKEGIVSRSYASGPRHGPAVTRLSSTSELWAHFAFGTLPAKGRAITTQWTLPGGRKLAANARARTRLVDAEVKQAAGTSLPKGHWQCVVRVGGVVVATLNVRLS